jgi:cyclohexa-1,5-dienecarbonyl-CoA hydratase
MTFEKIDFAVEGKVARITMHSSSANILDFPLIEELSSAVDQAGSCAFLVLSSSVKNFSLGVDIKIHTPPLIPEMLEKFHSLIRKIYHFPGVTICFVRGFALGGGFELALVNDFIFVEKNAALGLPEIKLACFPPVAAVLLPVIAGRAGMRMMFTGDTVTGEEACLLGIADGVVDQENFSEFQTGFLKKMTSYSFDALSVLKRVFRKTANLDFDGALKTAEEYYRDDLLRSPDVAEGIAAFLQKRPPNYRNH